MTALLVIGVVAIAVAAGIVGLIFREEAKKATAEVTEEPTPIAEQDVVMGRQDTHVE